MLDGEQTNLAQVLTRGRVVVLAPVQPAFDLGLLLGRSGVHVVEVVAAPHVHERVECRVGDVGQQLVEALAAADDVRAARVPDVRAGREDRALVGVLQAELHLDAAVAPTVAVPVDLAEGNGSVHVCDLLCIEILRVSRDSAGQRCFGPGPAGHRQAGG